MKVTTLKLPPELKKRIAPLAERMGKTPHAWMVETLRHEAERAELREQLIEDALAAAAGVDAGASVYGAGDVHDYILARASGGKPRRPRPVSRPRRR